MKRNIEMSQIEQDFREAISGCDSTVNIMFLVYFVFTIDFPV